MIRGAGLPNTIEQPGRPHSSFSQFLHSYASQWRHLISLLRAATI